MECWAGDCDVDFVEGARGARRNERGTETGRRVNLFHRIIPTPALADDLTIVPTRAPGRGFGPFGNQRVDLERGMIIMVMSLKDVVC